MEAWVNGEFAASFEVEMLVKNAAATGAASAYAEVAEMDYNAIYGE